MKDVATTNTKGARKIAATEINTVWSTNVISKRCRRVLTGSGLGTTSAALIAVAIEVGAVVRTVAI